MSRPCRTPGLSYGTAFVARARLLT
jgi:hypothetical protein